MSSAGLPSKRDGDTGVSSGKDNEDNKGVEASHVGGKAARAGTNKPGEEKAQEALTSVYKYLMREERSWGQSVVPCDRMRGMS